MPTMRATATVSVKINTIRCCIFNQVQIVNLEMVVTDNTSWKNYHREWSQQSDQIADTTMRSYGNRTNRQCQLLLVLALVVVHGNHHDLLKWPIQNRPERVCVIQILRIEQQNDTKRTRRKMRNTETMCPFRKAPVQWAVAAQVPHRPPSRHRLRNCCRPHQASVQLTVLHQTRAMRVTTTIGLHASCGTAHIDAYHSYTRHMHLEIRPRPANGTGLSYK